MRCWIPAVVFLAIFPLYPLATPAQSATDLATLADLKTASQQMRLESAGTPAFWLTANYQTFDFLGRPDGEGRWSEDWATHVVARKLTDSNAPENYAPEDQATMAAAPSTPGNGFMRQILIDALLHPGPSDEALAASKLTFKGQKVGALQLRCVLLEPLDQAKLTRYQVVANTRGYCMQQDAPIIRLTQPGFGLIVSYNKLVRFGGKLMAEQIDISQRQHPRGKLQVTKLVSAPELLTAAAAPTVEPVAPFPNALEGPYPGGVKLSSGVAAGQIDRKVQPIYPLEAKQKHQSGTVLLHAIISREGSIESLEVISAPSDSLAEAAIEAVSQWHYHPYLLNGQPTEVDTSITVNFFMT